MQLSDGNFGQGAYNAGLLFEMTGDIRALDVVIRLADKCVLVPLLLASFR